MGLTGQQRAQLAKALLAAFPLPSALEQMIRVELDKSLAEISIETNLRSIVFKLIADAEAEGWTSDLLRGARRANQGNEALLVVAQQLAPYLGGLGEPLPPPPPPPLPGGPNLLDLALPVARALQAAGNEAHPYVRADRLVRAFERALSLVAAVLVAGYVRRLHAGGDRLASMDEAIAALRLPGPAGWLRIISEGKRVLTDARHPAIEAARAAMTQPVLDQAEEIVALRREDMVAPERLTHLILEILSALGVPQDCMLVGLGPRGDTFRLHGVAPARLDPSPIRVDWPAAPHVYLVSSDAPGDPLDLAPVAVGVEDDAMGGIEVLLLAGQHTKEHLRYRAERRLISSQTRSDGEALRDVARLLLDPAHVPSRHAAAKLVGEPFRRLRAFEVRDEGLFFGRDHEVRDLADLVGEERLVVLHGASGTGKTSLLQAGLRPAIDTGLAWIDVRAPSDLDTKLLDGARAALGRRGKTLVADTPEAALAQLAEATSGPVLVVVDQFEELFQRRTVDEMQTLGAKVAETLRRVGRSTADVRVVIAMRDDYFGHLSFLKGKLPDVFEVEKLLLPLDRSGARQAIEEPFRLSGIELPRALAERMVKDLSGGAGETSPAELQIVCDVLYTKAKARWMARWRSATCADREHTRSGATRAVSLPLRSPPMAGSSPRAARMARSACGPC